MAGTEQYDHFKKLTDKQYQYCTLTEKLAVYQQHFPSMITALLEELMRATYPDWTPKEEPGDENPTATTD